ncbi:nuclease-related domain-containing protein [Sporosarcina sp. Te-1]|uniref:nuclease-related domain-containing protein n=1 Tax=Sporosarcina sp. Te-1 TaxID=2818390 RepID=UPI001A9F71DB|nr:nuclease-related domain-containing protein [Sporosarcina sp. Te-1]QTD41375.1 NERD domain-containing protein [Sporosarcina sp. Te-1]
MAQLVKLIDYISRYENDLSRYPTQFIRLKKSQWERMKFQWENGTDLSVLQTDDERVEDIPEDRKWYSPILRMFNRKQEPEEEQVEEQESESEEEFDFQPNLVYRPNDMAHLRKLYLDQLFHFQIKWASSTLMEKSRVDPRFFRDTFLRELTLNLPDSYLLFYYPILKVKKAPVELDIILLTPIECMCLTILEKEDAAVFVGESDRFWLKKYGEQESKLLNPTIGLNRMERIITGLFAREEIEFPIRKYIISRNGYIDYPGSPYDIQTIDRRAYQEWFNRLSQSTTPMKFSQFNAAQAILDIGQTTAMSRLFESFENQEEPDGEE